MMRLAEAVVASAKVSVIIPVHNGERYLHEAIASVRRQSIAPIEIVIVDDGSTDGTAAVAETLGSDIRLIRQPHSGVTISRNRGVRTARGEFIAFLDCDDVWTDDKLATQVPILLAHSDIQIALGHTRRMWTPPARDGAPSGACLTEPELALHLGGALIRRTIFERVDTFDETVSHAEDWDWFMRVRERGLTVVVHPEVMLLYRRHGDNMSNNEPETRAALVRMVHRSIQRRRSQGGDLAPLPDLPFLDQYLQGRAAIRGGAEPA
jgi:glycosyltransferase involved in cell wall biosynthesis